MTLVRKTKKKTSAATVQQATIELWEPLLTDSQQILKEEKRIYDETEFGREEPAVIYEVTSYGADYVVSNLIDRVRSGDFYIPTFQRSYVWTIEDASRFIESLLLGLPVPGIFISRESKSNKHLVIDGQQRLKSLLFFRNGIFDPDEGKEESKKRRKSIPFSLKGVAKRFNGLTYETLPDDLVRAFNDYVIHVTVIKQDSPTRDGNSSIYHVFERLNSQGRKLYAQEIRTALYHGPFVDLLKKLNKNKNWRELYGAESTRLKDRELILRFLALYERQGSYKRPMESFLSKYLSDNRDAPKERLAELSELFLSTIEIANKKLGKKAFRPGGTLNAAVLDSVLIAIAKNNSHNKLATGLEKRLENLFADETYLLATSKSTADEQQVKNRITKALKAFAQ